MSKEITEKGVDPKDDDAVDIKAEDLSAYSDDSYENDMPEPPPPRITRVIEPDQPQVPIMKGQYEITNTLCSWIGIWGMGIDNTILGITSEFRYTFKGPVDENSTIPLSGHYNGYFFYKTNVPRRVYEKDLILDFTPMDDKFQMVGKGSNEFGSYTLIGIFDPVTKDLTCTKEYQAVQKKKVKKNPSKPKPKPKPKQTPTSTSECKVKEENPENPENPLHVCSVILAKLIGHEMAGPFLVPVDPVKLNIPDYFDIIKRPMDLGTIKKQLAAHEIQSREEFAEKVRLVFDNAVLYNKPYDEVAIMANTLSEFFEREWSVVGTVKTKSAPVEIKVRTIPRHDPNRFAHKQLETFSRMTVLLRNQPCDVLTQNECVNQRIKACQVKRTHEQHQMEAAERGLCGVLVKPEPDLPLSFEEITQVHQQLLQLPETVCRNLLAPLVPALNNQAEVTLNLRDLPATKLREIALYLQKRKEEEFVDYLQKEEVKRRKQVTDRLIQSEKKVFAELLSD